MTLTDNELARYARQLSVQGWGAEGQLRLKSATVFVAGAGGLGCPAATYLAAAGVGKLVVCDADRVDRPNLNRQFFYSASDVGRDKAPIARERLLEINPTIEVEALTTEIDRRSAAGLIRNSDLVLDCLDNLETRLAINRAVITARIPMVYAAVSDLTGHLTFLNPPDTPCLECFLTRTPPLAEPAIPGFTAGIIGALQAMEAVKFLLGHGEILAGRLLVMEGAEPRFDVVEIERDPGCPACRGL
jgi:molybdopterin/thiamine biosynthesis adenylyltransferase